MIQRMKILSPKFAGLFNKMTSISIEDITNIVF